MGRLAYDSTTDSLKGSNTQTTQEKTYTFSTQNTYVHKNIKFTMKAQSAATPTLTITDKGTTNLTVGTLSDGYYPFSTSLSGKITVATAGWVATSGLSATDSSVIVGRLPASTIGSTASITTQPKVTAATGGTFISSTAYGRTTTQPSGTDGTNYLTLTSSVTLNNEGTATSYKTATAGYTPAISSIAGGTATTTVSRNNGTTYYMPIVAPTFSGGGLSTDTNTNTVSTTPVVTVSSSGTFKTTTGYGVTTTKPTSGTDGTNYLTIDGSGAVTTTGKATSSWKVNRAAATYSNSAGAIAAHSGTSAVASGSHSGGQTADITPSITDNFAPLYIPIVSASFSGGGLTENTNTNTVSTTPVVTVSSSGTFKTSTGYGVTTTKPTTGTDGTDYLTVDGSGAVTTTGKATSSWKATRAATTYSNSAGAIAAHSGTQAVASGSISNTKDVSITPSITDNFAPLYIPIVSPTFSGGGLTESTNTNTVATTPVVTVSSSGTFKTTTGYGVTTTKPTTGIDGTNYLTIDGSGAVTTTGKATSSWKVSRAAATYSNSAGAIAAHGSSPAIAAGDKSGTKDVSITPSITDNFAPLYIPIVSASFGGGGLTESTNTNTVSTTPVVTISSSGTFKTSTSYGVTTTKPSSGTDGTNYLTIDGSGTVSTTGKATSSWKVTRAATTYSNSAGAIAEHSGTQAIASGDKSGTKDVNITPSITDNFAPLYIPIVSASFSGGGLSTDTNTNTVSTTPVVTVSSSGTFKSATSYGVTTTKPTSGTDGTNYLTIDGSGAVTTTGKATSSWKVDRGSVTYTNSAGAIAAHSGATAVSTGSHNGGQTVNITPSITDSFAPLYIPIVSASFSGGGLTNTSNYSGTPTISMETGSSSNMANITVGAQDTTNYPYYFKVNASTAKLTGTTTVTRAAATYTNSAGAIAAHSGTQAIASGTSSPSVTVNAASNSTYVSLKKATMTVSGTNTVTPSSSMAGTNVVLGDTDNGIKIVSTGGGTASVTAKATTNAAGYAPASTDLGSATLSASNKTTTSTKYIKQITIPTAKSLGTGNASSTEGVIMTAGTSATALTKMYVSMANNSIIYLTDSVTGKTWCIQTDSVNNALSVWQD